MHQRCPTRLVEIITDLTSPHLVIDIADHNNDNDSGYRQKVRVIRESEVRSFLNHYILSANLSSDKMIKKVSTEEHFSKMSKSNKQKHQIEINPKKNTIKCLIDNSKIKTRADPGIFGPRTKCALLLDSFMNVLHAEIIAFVGCRDISEKEIIRSVTQFFTLILSY